MHQLNYNNFEEFSFNQSEGDGQEVVIVACTSHFKLPGFLCVTDVQTLLEEKLLSKKSVESACRLQIDDPHRS